MHRAHLLGKLLLRHIAVCLHRTQLQQQRLCAEPLPCAHRLRGLRVKHVHNSIRLRVRRQKRHILAHAVKIIQPLARDIRAGQTLGRLLGELSEVDPHQKPAEAVVRCDGSLLKARLLPDGKLARVNCLPMPVRRFKRKASPATGIDAQDRILLPCRCGRRCLRQIKKLHTGKQVDRLRFVRRETAFPAAAAAARLMLHGAVPPPGRQSP